MTFAPPVFRVNDDSSSWIDYLDTNGYVVLTDILSKSEKSELFQTFKREMNRVSPNFDFENSKTWDIKNTPAMFGKGMAIFNGFGQSDFMWKLRTHPNIQSPYKTLFKTDKLVTSLDGFSLFVSQNQKSKSWLHTDQHPDNQIYSIQGSYNLFRVDRNDAGFVVVPESHKTFSPKDKPKKDWIVVDQDYFKPKSVKLLVPENSLTLWNSRLVHANMGMSKTREQPDKINRITAYVTFLPEALRTEKVRSERIKTYIDGKTTSHWSNRCEVKRYPFGFKKLYESRGFNTLTPTMTADGKIPAERLELL